MTSTNKFQTILICVLVYVAVARAQYTNVRVSSPSSTSPEEVTIAINPTNPLNLVAGANIRFAYSSFDGGQSWAQHVLPVGTYGDPCTIFDVNGRAYFAHLSDNSTFGGYWVDRMTVHRSSDGGATWFDSATTAVNPPKQQDKEWLACDGTNSAYRNTLYMGWTEFDAYGSSSSKDSTRILFSRSTDGGASWQTPMRISDEGGNCLDGDGTVEGAVPAVGPAGEVYIAWAGPKGIIVDRSFDGGVTFGKDIFVTTMPGGWDYGVPGIYRCNGLPVTACDVSQSAYRGRVYVLWADQRNGSDNTDVFIVRSTDKGVTWSQPKRVNTDGGIAQQFFPWLAVDQSNGNLSVVFYDRRNYAATDSTTDVYLATSTDGGDSWGDVKISQTSFLPRPDVFFGDYINIVADKGKVYPIWMRLDGRNLSVWTTRIDQTSSVMEEHPAAYRLDQNYPNPFNPSTNIMFTLPARENVTLKVFDVLGREVQTMVRSELPQGNHTAIFYGDDLPSGVYFYQLHAGPYSETKRMILLK